MRRAAGVLLGIAVVVVGAAGFAGCSSCARRAEVAREDLALLPKDTNLLVAINVRRARDTAVWRKLLDLRDQPEMKTRFDEFVASCGFDPFQQLESATFAFPPPETEAEFGGILRGTFDEQKLVACTKEEGQKKGRELRIEEYEGKKLYTDTGQVVGAFLDGKTLVLGGPGWTRKIVDLAAGRTKESAQGNAVLMELVKKTRTGDAVWAAGSVPETVRRRFESLSDEAVKSMKNVRGSVDFAAGLELAAAFELGSDAHAKELTEKLQKQLGEAKKSPDTMMLGLSSMIDAVKVSADGATLKIDVKYNQAQVDQLVERLQGALKKPTAGGGLGGGGGGGLPSLQPPQ